MSTGGNRFGPPYLSAVLGEAKKRTGKQVVTDFRGQGFIPILVAGICNPAGPTLTIFSFSKPDESGESWLCEHMLNPFQTSFHRMTKVRSADIGLTAEGMNDGGRDQALLAFADVHLTQDQSFTPGTFHTYCPAVSRTATESALLAWMEQSDSTPRDLDDLTRLPYKSDHLSRATFARIQERMSATSALRGAGDATAPYGPRPLTASHGTASHHPRLGYRASQSPGPGGRDHDPGNQRGLHLGCRTHNCLRNNPSCYAVALGRSDQRRQTEPEDQRT